MAQQQTTSANQTTTPSSSSLPNLYPPLDSTIAELDINERNLAIVRREKELVSCLKEVFNDKNILDGVTDRSIVPTELLVSSKKIFRPKIDPLKRLKDLNPEKEESDEEEEEEDDEDEEELEPVVEEDEEDAAGDYLVSHFDNGENFEENDDEDDDNVVN